MSVAVKIRNMDEADVDAAKELEVESGLSPWTKQDYLKEIERSDGICISATSGRNKLVGFGIARITPADKFEGVADIYNICVSREVRRNGIGRLILGRILEVVSRQRISTIWLDVRESNTNAKKFYQEKGFSEIKIRKNFYSRPTENSVAMKLEIDSQKKVLANLIDVR